MEDGQGEVHQSLLSTSHVQTSAAVSSPQSTAFDVLGVQQPATPECIPVTRVRLLHPTQGARRHLQARQTSHSQTGSSNQVEFDGLEGHAASSAPAAKQIRLLNCKLTQGFFNINQQMSDNQACLDATFDFLTEATGELSKDRCRQRSRKHKRATRLEAMTRAIGRLSQLTTQHTRRTMTLLVEMGYDSGDMAQGLQQIAAAMEAFQTVIIASGATGEVPDSAE
ncbi:hypothetical protein NDU88_007570 [Pleurodeles waltl]|uniref:Uncharacterized protein n=1 Tax=Pleurodeles waltl TaxID=8319 RepID=A0AAV7U3H0_PLEWA|nr:hypothetical protein NDU88_007570 [Pleurodeles waltl]